MILTPVYLRYRDANEDKAFITCSLPNSNMLIGESPWIGGAVGTWCIRKSSVGRQEEAQRRTQGYQPCNCTDVPLEMIREMIRRVARQTKLSVDVVHFRADGCLEIDVPAGAVRSAQRAAPRRLKGKGDQIRIWLGGARPS